MYYKELTCNVLELNNVWVSINSQTDIEIDEVGKIFHQKHPCKIDFIDYWKYFKDILFKTCFMYK